MIGPMPSTSVSSSSRRGEQRVHRAEAGAPGCARSRSRCRGCRARTAPGGRAAASTPRSRRPGCAPRSRRSRSSSASRSTRQLVDVGHVLDQPLVQEAAGVLLAQALDVHRARTKCLTAWKTWPGQPARLGQIVQTPVLGLDGGRAAGRALAPAARAPGCGSCALLRLGRGRDHLRDHVAGAHHDHLVAVAHVLAAQVLLVVERGELHRHARHLHRLELRERHHVAGAAHVPGHALERGGGRRGRRTSRRSPRAARGPPRRAGAAGRGRRPSPPRRRSRSRAGRGAPPRRGRRRPPRRRCRARSTSRFTRKPCSRSHSSDSWWVSNSSPSTAPTP